MKILADVDIPFVQPYFGSVGELILKSGRLIQHADLEDVDILLVRSVTPVNAALLQNTPVKFVGTVSAGTDHLDITWLNKEKISWHSAAGYNAAPVADYVVSTIAALTALDFSFNAAPIAGVVGVGHVGSLVAQHLRLLGFIVKLCDPLRAAQESGFVSCALADLSTCDLITLHAPFTSTGLYPTHHLINAAFLEAAPKKNILINTSRGAVVDGSSLKASKKWDSCLDVWETEPRIDLTLLQSAVLASPHMAGYSVQCRYRGIEKIYQAFCQEFNLNLRPIAPLPVLPQRLWSFSGAAMTWQGVVLSIFNPITITQKMQESLLKAPEKCATLFDLLRGEYIGDGITRHEFAYATISQVVLQERDRHILTQLGITIKE